MILRGSTKRLCEEREIKVIHTKKILATKQSVEFD